MLAAFLHTVCRERHGEKPLPRKGGVQDSYAEPKKPYQQPKETYEHDAADGYDAKHDHLFDKPGGYGEPKQGYEGQEEKPPADTPLPIYKNVPSEDDYHSQYSAGSGKLGWEIVGW